MDNLSQWCFQLSRSIYDSEIFNKPSDWFKVWIYILWKVNFKDNWLPRGSAYFKYEWIERDCKVKYNIVTKICKYLKEKNQIEVKKATHGCIISVVNYSLYQWIENYKGKTEARQRQDRGKTGVDNIYKNEIMQEWNNIKDWFEDFWRLYPHARKWNKKLSREYYKKSESTSDEIINEIKYMNWCIRYWLIDWKYISACERRIRDFVPTNAHIKEQNIKKIVYALMRDKNPEVAKQITNDFGKEIVDRYVKDYNKEFNTPILK